MEIEEVKVKAKKLKDILASLVLDFENETGCTVTNLQRTGFVSLSDAPTVSYVEFDVKVCGVR